MQLRFFANPKIPDADYDWPPLDDAPAAPAAEAPDTPTEEPAPDPEPEAAPEPEPTYTLPQVRTKLAEAKRKGIAWSIIGNVPEKAKLDEIAKFSN